MTVPFTLLAKVAAMDSVIVLLIFNPVHTDFHTNRQDLLNSNSGGVYFYFSTEEISLVGRQENLWKHERSMTATRELSMVCICNMYSNTMLVCTTFFKILSNLQGQISFFFGCRSLYPPFLNAHALT